MQIFLFFALTISFFAVLFALQNIVPVNVSFLAWTFEGSLALVLFVSLVAGALISFLASLPSLVKGRLATTQQRKQVAALEASLAECRSTLQEAQTRLRAHASPQPPSTAPTRRPDNPDAPLEPST